MRTISSRSAIVLLIGSALAGAACAAPDYVREKHLAGELAPSIAAAEAVALKTSAGRTFLGLLRAAKKPRAALILVHGAGVHPDFGLVGKLRTLLVDRGYTSLSIQMPVLAADANAAEYVALFPEAGQRLEAAMAYLRAREMDRIGLISHGMGTRMANEFIVRHPNAQFMAWLPLSASTGRLESLARVRFPIFDIYAEHDLDAVRRGAAGRAKVLRGHRGSKQAMVYGTNHDFARKEKEVAALIDQLLTPLAN
jgi:hypothetical protein